MLSITKYFLIVFLGLLAFTPSFSQQDSLTFSSNPFNKKRLAAVVGVEVALYSGTLLALNELWYKDYPRSSFHRFSDNQEWMHMDKAGHMVTAYSVGRVGYDLLSWSGVKRKNAIWYGGMLGSIFLNTVEILDGYSSEWGFSVGDLGANTAGSLFFVMQQSVWDEQRMVLKYSFQQSEYAQYRPELLGDNLQEDLLKDYNGQTYWLSLNLYSFMDKETRFPKWLNIAFGYGADGMVGGKFNPTVVDNMGSVIPIDRYRQYYFSLDIDLTRIKTKSVFLNTVFHTIGFIKFPAPAIEFSKHGVKGLLLGF